MAQGSKFSTGKYAKAIDDRFGEKFDYRQMVVEPDTKLFVHQDDADEPDPYRRLRSRQDAIALRSPRPETDIAEVDPVADGICLSQSAAAAQALTLNGSFVSGGVATLDSDGNPKQVVITSVGNDRGISFVITGTILPSVTGSETLTGANAGVAGSTNVYYTVTGITTTGATAGAVQAGTTTEDDFFEDDPGS